jgi:hypothetical protein
MSKPKPNPQQLQTIDPAALAQVSGGATATTTPTTDPVLTALTGILDSIQSLQQQQTGGGGMNQQEMLMMMIMMQQRNAQQAAAAAAASTWATWSQQPIIHYY